MTCDHCKTAGHRRLHLTAETAPQCWCDACCDAAGIELGPWRNWEPVADRNYIRERWEAERKAQQQEKFQAFLKTRREVA